MSDTSQVDKLTRVYIKIRDKRAELSKRFNDSRVTIHCRLPQKYLGRISDPGTEVRPHQDNGCFEGNGRTEPTAETDTAVEDVA